MCRLLTRRRTVRRRTGGRRAASAPARRERLGESTAGGDDRGGNFAGTRVGILCRIVSDVGAVVGRVDGDLADPKVIEQVYALCAGDGPVLVESGPGSTLAALTRGLTDIGFTPSDVRHVFLTHAHLDHIAGLPMLIDSIFTDEVDIPVTVYGRAETLKAIQDHLFNWVIWPDFAVLPNPENPMLRYQVCNPGDTVTIGHRHFHAVDVAHSVPAIGYTVQNSGGVFAVSGDTKTNETLWPVLNACDDLRVLVIEVSFPNEMAQLANDAGHYCPNTLVKDLQRLPG